MSYLKTDPFKDVENSAEIVLWAIELVDRNEAMWKVIVSQTYLALQGACVCMLTKTDSSGPFTKNGEKQIRNYWDLVSQRLANQKDEEQPIPEPAFPNEKLASLGELLKRLPERHRVAISDDYAADVGDEQRAIMFLRDVRNQFSHFPPTSWLIDIPSLQSSIVDVLEKTLEIVRSNEFASRNRFTKTLAAERLVQCVEAAKAKGWKPD